MGKIKITQKQKDIAKILINYKDFINSYEFIKDNKQALEKLNINTQRINSVNATLSSLALKGLVDKDKRIYKDRIIVHYKANTLLKDLLKENN